METIQGNTCTSLAFGKELEHFRQVDRGWVNGIRGGKRVKRGRGAEVEGTGSRIEEAGSGDRGGGESGKIGTRS